MGKYTCEPLTTEQFNTLLSTIRNGYESHRTPHKPNKQVADILYLQVNIGCRIDAIINLNTDNIINQCGVWKYPIIDNKKIRIYTIRPDIKEYIDNLGSGKLFTITKQAVWKCLRQATDYLGYDNVSTESIRKYSAQLVYEQTESMDAVKEFTQQKYVNTLFKTQKETD